MPRPNKSLKTLFVETVLFICLFALVGHLSVNFWERYVIQNELTKMKTSLHSLKDTINNIGVAYDHLHKELKDLAEIAEKGPPESMHRKPPDKVDCKKFQSLTEIYRSTPIQTTTVSTVEMKTSFKPITEEKYTQNCLPKILAKNISTITNSPRPLDKSDKMSGTFWTSVNKTTQYVVTHKCKPIPHPKTNASTITRYPLKSSGTGEKSVYDINGTCLIHSDYADPRYYPSINNKNIKRQIQQILNSSSNIAATAW